VKKTASPTGPPTDAYALALEQEREAWQVLHSTPRTDPRYAKALADWQAAADRIDKLLAPPAKT
jgi:hypothetical protein